MKKRFINWKMRDPSKQLRIQTSLYKRPFSRPMQAAWGTWSLREGILIRLEDCEGRYGFGECAPLSQFGSESIETAAEFLNTIDAVFSKSEIEQIAVNAPPACGFGIWSALMDIEPDHKDSPAIRTAALFTLDSDWKNRIDHFRRSGISTFKLKLGTQTAEKEKSLLAKVMEYTGREELVRIDPNRNWSLKEYEQWAKWLKEYSCRIEFIEDPIADIQMSRSEFSKWAAKQDIPLALDESLSIDGFQEWMDSGWTGYWIIKPSLSGIPVWSEKLNSGQVILSSAFETGIGLNAILALSGKYPATHHGIGTGSYFNDELSQVPVNGSLQPFTKSQLQKVWSHYCKD